MSRRDQFGDTDWHLLTQMPTLAAFGAMAAEAGGPVTSTRELWAGMQELAESARSDYPNNVLIQEVARTITHRTDGSELSLEDWHASGPEALQEAVVEQALDTAAKVRRTLATTVSAEDGAQYTDWVMGIAQAGVHGAGSGFLGLLGDEVTPKESKFLEELAAALGDAPESG